MNILKINYLLNRFMKNIIVSNTSNMKLLSEIY